jgi:hypothetical protein
MPDMRGLPPGSLASAVSFQGVPAAASLLRAIDMLRAMNDTASGWRRSS